MNWTTGTLHANGLNLYYTRTGGDKPALLLLHGITDFGGNWRTFARLVEDRFDVIMPDFRSHGGSSRKPDYDANALADDALGTLRALGIAQATVMGHSMGAVTALRLAARETHCVSKLVLEDPPFWAVHTPTVYEMSTWEQSLIDFKALDAAAQQRKARENNPNWTTEEADLWGEAKIGFDLDGFKSPIKLHWPDWRADTRAMGERRIPGLLVLGEPAKGGIVSPAIAAEMQTLWPQLKSVTIPNTGHNVRRDNLAAYAQAVLDYLNTSG
jgi:N-formylmaleamate deformylase